MAQVGVLVTWREVTGTVPSMGVVAGASFPVSLAGHTPWFGPFGGVAEDLAKSARLRCGSFACAAVLANVLSRD